MTTPLRHAIAFTAALPVALLAHDSGMEPAYAATAAILLPTVHAGIDLAVNGPDLSLRRIAGCAAFHTATITALGLFLTSLLGTL
ncbi:MAG: hypothetical protein OXG04_29020 [Acidobacteria bacterium]|nr:hypothetical protein [Acidobacteriota bacterium]